ncbi:MAG: hypothetical protein JWR35_2399 [Marmoricola sp.]|nr:hypothetical protein [Marmoricola sp.]
MKSRGGDLARLEPHPRSLLKGQRSVMPSSCTSGGNVQWDR